MTFATEVNFDGLPGPTHNYAGLSYGNEASTNNESQTSNPQKAVLQSLAKAKFMHDLGLKQGILPPHERPHIPTLKAIGFQGTRKAILEEAKRKAPWIFKYIMSSAPMWAANAATITPSIDTASKRLQVTAANLNSKFHRSIESDTTSLILKRIFANPVFFEHHTPLFNHPLFGDEGAANHIRFCKAYHLPGVHLFFYGEDKENPNEGKPTKYPARQTRQASQAICEQHKIFSKQTVIAKQSYFAIDRGVFHNDVISMGNQNLYIAHEYAFESPEKTIPELKEKVKTYCDTDLNIIQVSNNEVPIKDAVQSFLFNSQIVTLPDGSMRLIAPSDCLEVKSAESFLKDLAARSDNPITEIHYMDLKQSMKNGGGPACLRLQAILNDNELKETLPSIWLNETLYTTLVAWAKKHYRDQLNPQDLWDPNLWDESERALDELTQILKLGSIYSFQI